MTTLQLRKQDDRTMILTDHRGKPLPCQKAVAWSHGGADEVASVTVEFMIDGRDIVVTDAAVDTGSGTLAEAARAWAALSPANRKRFLAMNGLAVEHEGMNGRQTVEDLQTGDRYLYLGQVKNYGLGVEAMQAVRPAALLRPLSMFRPPEPILIDANDFNGPRFRRLEA